MKKIVFFNHYHRGDLHTHKEFVRQIMEEVKDVEYEYLHNNPEKLIIDLGIKTKGSPNRLDSKNALYKEKSKLLFLTHIKTKNVNFILIYVNYFIYLLQI